MKFSSRLKNKNKEIKKNLNLQVIELILIYFCLN